jgi:hypothetical protein
VKRTLLCLIVAAVLVIGFVIYRSKSSRPDLNVDPHAREEIEKAMRH